MWAGYVTIPFSASKSYTLCSHLVRSVLQLVLRWLSDWTTLLSAAVQMLIWYNIRLVLSYLCMLLLCMHSWVHLVVSLTVL